MDFYYLDLDGAEEPEGDDNWEFIRFMPAGPHSGTERGDRGFFVVDDALGKKGKVVWDSRSLTRGTGSGNLWKGWLACDWVHGSFFRCLFLLMEGYFADCVVFFVDSAQLFWLAAKNQTVELPVSCDLVDLVIEEV